MKKLPESFGIMRDADNPLWEKFIAWLRKMNNNEYQPHGKSNWYYGVIDGSYSCNTEDASKFKTILTLEQWDSIVNPKTEFKAMKFRVDSPEHSKQIQERLFEMGYKWLISKKEVCYADRYYLATTESGIIEWGATEESFKRCDEIETTLSDISPWQPKQGEVIEVSQDGSNFDDAKFIVMYNDMFICKKNYAFKPWSYARPRNPSVEEAQEPIEFTVNATFKGKELPHREIRQALDKLGVSNIEFSINQYL